ncbi:Pyruvate, water dikinase [Solidesulfovibrio carbinoliphilus subsp. oakridgensis]|uniref:Phosphoenolpyruvate synthase n=1 Tax=Solidesulfovibrio carbinoliphilus subsp. oakridgensis TaxID=694327 RepID=G7QB20_9BACT|nr:PEP/pyruvate-binding domain-containing protein [Solidesulfovibrio carbinoliphilus]EHJ48762.1 Pyruvate, water dikinase [Solidesulfovibrio carbinoliphilus subsp. oakridgensis]
MIGRLWKAWRDRREARNRAALDALKVRYHTFRILLANNERALERLAGVEAALASGAPGGELAGLVEDLQAVTFELVDGVSRLAGQGANALYARQLRLEEALRAALEAVEDTGRGPSCLPLARPLDAREVGGKAAGLSELRRNGFPVPDGFAVTVTACRAFLRETGLDARLRQALGRDGGNDALAAVRADILATPLPGWLAGDLRAAAGRLAPAALAARSSALSEDLAEHSFAGQFETVLHLSPDTLGQGFLTVMAGAFSERAVAYRREAGLPPAVLDMAVCVQAMVPAVGAGVVFTSDPVRPETGRMLVSAVPGLGVLAVDGAAPADIIRIRRDDPTDMDLRLAKKTLRAVPDPAGGVRREAVPPGEADRPVLSPAVLTRLVRLALAAESLAGTPRDLEYAVDVTDRVWLLQSRPARVAHGSRRQTAPDPYYQGGMTASPGRCLGVLRHMATEADLAAATNGPAGPVIAVLPTAAPEAARFLPGWQGLVVAGGNPADHLSTVARETGRPLLTRAAGAVEALPDGAAAVLDAGRCLVTPAHPAIGDLGELLASPAADAGKPAPAPLSPARARIHDLTLPLTLTDAYGPTFAAIECRTLHDIIRFAHETAILALFEAGDEVLEESFSQVRILRGGVPFEVMVIDLGGGLREEAAGRFIGPSDVASIPLAALWQGLATPGLRFGAPPPGSDIRGVMAKGATDGRSRRPVGEPNYALAARDYVNVNARVEFHFAMIDAVCGPRAGGNYVRLRFKGGGAATPLRHRRASCLEEILQAGGFFVNRQGDLVTAHLLDASREATEKGLVLLGRLLGFTRLLDAAMTDDAAPRRAAAAFLAGDYGLATFAPDHPAGHRALEQA